jgi:hypothetical protein
MKLRENIFDHVPVNVGQPEIPACVTVGEFLVVESHQVQDGGVVIVDMNAIADDAGPDVVGFAVNRSAFNSGAR